MCAKILEDANQLNMEEYQFFLKGGVVLDRGEQMDNPCDSKQILNFFVNFSEFCHF